jgi:hypothetical protein
MILALIRIDTRYRVSLPSLSAVLDSAVIEMGKLESG